MAKKNVPNDTAVVAMSNDIIPAFAKLKLSESRLFQYCLAHYDSRGEENPTFEASVADFKSFFHIDYDSAYTVVHQAFINLSTRPLKWREDKVVKVRHWFDGFDYHTDRGSFSFKINKDAKPFFLMLKKFFTRYRLAHTKNFKRTASFKLYVNLKQWENTGIWTVDIDELRLRLGVAGKYPRWGNLRQWIILPVVSEINEHSDLHVTWKAERYGRRIDKIIFKIRKKAEAEAKCAKEIHEMNEMNDKVRKTETKEALNRVDLGDPNYVPRLPGQMSIGEGIRDTPLIIVQKH